MKNKLEFLSTEQIIIQCKEPSINNRQLSTKKMTKQEKIDAFNPSGIGLHNGNFIGLPFSEEESEIVLLPIPWDVTVSSAEGTATGPENILAASAQLDLGDLFAPDAWKRGIFFKQKNTYWARRSTELRILAKEYIAFLEEGGNVTEKPKMQRILDEINYTSENLKRWVKDETKKLLKAGKRVGLVGGDHSTPLGYLEALAEHHGDFGILQIDAHMDLRDAYEGFTFSHASIFNNAMKIKEVTHLTQLGIRDFCEEELETVRKENGRIVVYFDENIKTQMYGGISFATICQQIVESLPQRVYVSFDIDGLRPELCPGTGTPVPGGLDFQQACYLLRQVRMSGREIIGFDLCEVAGLGHDWDGNVGARVLYRLCGVLS